MSKKTIIIIVAVVLVILAFLFWFFYRQGKKQVTLQSLPGELPGNSGSGNVVGASNDEIKKIANDLYADMKGASTIYFGRNKRAYEQANLLNDTDIVKLYNTFNSLYQKESGQTLTEWVSSEWYVYGTAEQAAILIARLKKLNCL